MASRIVARQRPHFANALRATVFAAVLAGCTTSPAHDRSTASAPTSSAATASAPAIASAPIETSSLTADATARGATVPASGELPAGAVVPDSVAGSNERVPFVLLLHGYGGNGASIARHFGFPALARARKFIYLAPDGVKDSKNARFWNAGEACCDFDHAGPDHVAELGRVIAQARSSRLVDPSRIFVVGYSNGGFMAHRLACDVEGIAGIGSVAGSVSFDPSACKNAPLSIVQVHGDADPVVHFDGGYVLGRTNVARHAGAFEGIRQWAHRLGCDATAARGPKFDLDPAIAGLETEPSTFSCAPGVAFLRVAGGEHDIASEPSSMARVLELVMSGAKGP
ncbi:MAG: hypothetical protein HOW73_21955 [Polyangiaceae bacterium]|nr:hypothetical protein [Polyangiaceae bacterium]